MTFKINIENIGLNLGGLVLNSIPPGEVFKKIQLNTSMNAWRNKSINEQINECIYNLMNQWIN